MSIFDEDKVISKEFLKANDFNEYRKGYYIKTYKHIDIDEDRFYNIDVIYASKNNNLWVEKASIWERNHFWKNKVYDEMDFLAIIKKYNLE